MNCISCIFKSVNCIGDFLKDFLLLALRLYWGWNFLAAGWGKFGNIPMVTDMFSSIQIPLPLFNAYLVASVELIGGFCLLIGLAARLVSIPLAITMIVALFTAHLTETLAGFQNPQRLIVQLPFVYLLTCLIILCFGPGKFSVDTWIEKRFKR
jgi:putative oxidoreductase